MMYGEGCHGKKSGPIPYRINKQDRLTILRQIEQLFGDELRAEHASSKGTGEHKYILVAVDTIRKNLSGETCEDVVRAENREHK
jgi:hypothetical protein